MEAKIGAPRVPTYEEFEPFCTWQREEGRETLVVHLPDFKKEQLKVQVSSRGILTVSGERTLDAFKKSKFYKEVEVPKNCNKNGIQAKFANGCLYILMPKLKTVAPEQSNPLVIGSSLEEKMKAEANQERAKRPTPAEENREPAGSAEQKMVPALNTSTDGKKSQTDVTLPEDSASRVKAFGKMAVNCAAVLGVVAALGVYVYYMYRSILFEDY